MSKDEAYWNAVHDTAEEIKRLSTEIQGPLIEQHVDDEMVAEMSIGEITDHIKQFYTEEDHQAWNAVESAGLRLAAQYQISPNEVSHDIWIHVSGTPTTAQHHH